MDIYNLVLQELERRRVAFVQDFIPYYLCSLGCHLLNIENKKRHFYYEHGRIPDLRLHVMQVAPPGFSKSFFMKQLLQDVYGVLGGAVPSTFEEYVTQAGFAGTFDRDAKGKVIKKPGLIELFKDGIVALEEFSALTKAMQQEHSFGLDAAVLDALDSGIVKRRLGGGPIVVETQMSMWAGTQVTRFALTGGLGRRFFFIVWVPTEKERMEIKRMRREGRGLKFDAKTSGVIHKAVENTKLKLLKVNDIEFTKELDALLESRVHYEDLLFERLAMGYKVIRGDFDTCVVLEPDDVLRVLFRRGFRWRDRLLAQSQGDQVVQVLKDRGDKDGCLPWNLIRDELVVYGLDYRSSALLIRQLAQSKIVTVRRGKVCLR